MRLLLFILFPFISHFAFSQVLPREWTLLLDCIQANQKLLPPVEISNIKISLTNLNNSLNHVPQERVSPLLKFLLYRYLMEIPPAPAQNKTVVSISEIEYFFNQYNSKLKGSFCTFTSWVVEALESDFYNIKNKIDPTTLNTNVDISITFRSYLPAWINVLGTQNTNETEKILSFYYSVLIQDIAKELNLYSNFSPSQPTINNYINWSFESPQSSESIKNAPLDESADKSPADLIERNLPNPENNKKGKTQLIDDLIRKRKEEKY